MQEKHLSSCCRSCHFLTRFNWMGNPPRYEQIPLEKRAGLNSAGPCCYHGEWNSDNSILARSIENLEKLLDQPNRDCFFQYQRGMTLEAGKRRQSRETEDKQARKNHFLMMISIFLSAIAALSGLVYIYDKISSWGI